MNRIFRKLLLKFRPLETGDSFYGYTDHIIDDDSVKHLKRIVCIDIVESKEESLMIRFKYTGKGRRLINKFKVIPRRLLEKHYINNTIHFC